MKFTPTQGVFALVTCWQRENHSLQWSPTRYSEPHSWTGPLPRSRWPVQIECRRLVSLLVFVRWAFLLLLLFWLFIYFFFILLDFCLPLFSFFNFVFGRKQENEVGWIGRSWKSGGVRVVEKHAQKYSVWRKCKGKKEPQATGRVFLQVNLAFESFWALSRAWIWKAALVIRAATIVFYTKPL